jgi:hypothetical protein
VSNKK